MGVKIVRKERRHKEKLLSVAVMILLLSFLYMFAVTFFEIPESGKEHSKTIVGFLLGVGLANLMNYYWGGAHEKDRPPKQSEETPVPPVEDKP